MSWREQVTVEWECDGCGVEHRDVLQLGDRPDGWTTRGDFDYCGACS